MSSYLLQVTFDIDAEDDPGAREQAQKIFDKLRTAIVYTGAEVSFALNKRIGRGGGSRRVKIDAFDLQPIISPEELDEALAKGRERTRPHTAVQTIVPKQAYTFNPEEIKELDAALERGRQRALSVEKAIRKENEGRPHFKRQHGRETSSVVFPHTYTTAQTSIPVQEFVLAPREREQLKDQIDHLDNEIKKIEAKKIQEQTKHGEKKWS